VVVMSPRPGQITELIDVKLGRPRSFDVEAQPGFQEATHRIRQLIFGNRDVAASRAA
jgi:NitT/TauT family transport system ATP-binding protein